MPFACMENFFFHKPPLLEAILEIGRAAIRGWVWDLLYFVRNH